MQGKLAEQRAEEGTGEELYQQIQVEKQKLIKEGKIKKEKVLDVITDDEIPFDIPETWKWCRLGTLTYNWGQKTPDSRFCYVDVGSVNNNANTLNNENTIIEAKDASSRARRIVKYGDVIFATIRPYLKNICIIDREFPYEPIVSTAFAVMHCPNGLLNKYLYYYLLSPTFMSFANASDKAKGVAYPAIGEKDFFNGIIALPPLVEQKRIVAKIEELLPIVDRYAFAYEKLEKFNAKFPKDMKKSILQYAIQGKLVEQRVEDGTADVLYQQIQDEKQRLINEGKIKTEKTIQPLKENELPFDIPESWMWCSVGSVCTNIQYGTSNKSSTTGTMPVLRMGNIQDGKIIYDKLVYTSDEDEIQKYQLNYNDLLFNRTNSREIVGKTAIYKAEMPAIYAGYLVRLTPILVDSDYLNYVMQTKYYWSYCQSVRSDAIGQSNINAEKLKRFYFPLPPLAEQKRIVSKIEELLPYCEKLVKEMEDRK